MLSRTWQILSNTTDTTKRLLNARRTQHNLTESPKSHQHTCTPETEWSYPCFHCFPARQALARLKLIGLAFDQPQSVQVTRERTVAIAFHETSGFHFMTCHSHVAKSWPMWTQCTQYRTQYCPRTAAIILQTRLVCEHVFTISINLVYLQLVTCDFTCKTRVQLLFLELLRLI